MKFVAILGFLILSSTSYAGSICILSESNYYVSNPKPGCGSNDAFVQFSTTCDGGVSTLSEPKMIVSACADVQANDWMELESGALAGLVGKGYHLVGNYRNGATNIVFLLEK